MPKNRRRDAEPPDPLRIAEAYGRLEAERAETVNEYLALGASVPDIDRYLAACTRLGIYTADRNTAVTSAAFAEGKRRLAAGETLIPDEAREWALNVWMVMRAIPLRLDESSRSVLRLTIGAQQYMMAGELAFADTRTPAHT